MKWGFIALAILAGLSNPVQSAANAGLNKALGNPLLAVLVIYGVSLVGLAVLTPFLGLPFRALAEKASVVPWWAWIGGFCGLTFALSATIATREIGSATFTLTVLVAAALLSIVLDHFGIMGLERRPATWLRLLGGAAAVAGVTLVAKF